MNTLIRKGTLAGAVLAVLWIVDQARSQSPARNPTGGDQEQIVNLQLRVTHLEQALAQLQQQVASLSKGSGSASTVVAPFTVKDPRGTVLLEVTGGTGGAVLGMNDKGFRTVQIVAADASMLLSTSGPTGGTAFLGTEDGHPVVDIRDRNRSAVIGAASGAPMGVRLYSKNNTPAAGMNARDDGTGFVFVGASNNALAGMTVANGHGYISINNDKGTSLVELSTTEGGAGGSVRTATQAGQNVAILEVNDKGNGGHAVLTDASGTPLLKLGSTGSFGDLCIVIKGGGRCLGEMLPAIFH